MGYGIPFLTFHFKFLFGTSLHTVPNFWKVVCVLVAQLCLTLQLHGLWPARFLCPWNSLGQNTGVGCHSLFQGIFLTQGLNPGLPHCRQILYLLSHHGNPEMLLSPSKQIFNLLHDSSRERLFPFKSEMDLWPDFINEKGREWYCSGLSP